jgi:hypothetical protein
VELALVGLLFEVGGGWGVGWVGDGSGGGFWWWVVVVVVGGGWWVLLRCSWGALGVVLMDALWGWF